MNIGCWGELSCYNTNFYCPSNDKNVCNLDCNDSNSCFYMDIFLTDFDFTRDFMFISASNSTKAAFAYGNYVKCPMGSTEILYANNTFSCSNNPYCCPWVTDDYVCAANSTCIIDCSQSYVIIYQYIIHTIHYNINISHKYSIMLSENY